MSTDQLCPDVAAILADLKPFQLATVQHAYQCLYDVADGSHRFLVADEVGLGKTYVARGVIARVVERLWERVDRIDVVYICSNQAIAAQNIQCLTIGEHVPLNTRITMLPAELHRLQQGRLNFISLTPGTSFDQGQRLGKAEERALLYRMLRRIWGLEGVGARKLLMGNVSSLDRFDAWVRSIRQVDEDLLQSYAQALERHARHDKAAGTPDIQSRFLELARLFSRRVHIPRDLRDRRSELVGELRTILAASCLTALEPDVVILDEFQRFKHLLRHDNPAGELARTLFEYSDDTGGVRVLLLSATPYKMYTLDEERADDDHYADFLETVRFLLHDDNRTTELEKALTRFRRELYHLPSSMAGVAAAKGAVQSQLTRVMCRTERLAASMDRNGMLLDVPSPPATVEGQDLTAYLAIQEVSRIVGSYDVTELWKSAPYLLNFMDEYKLRQQFREAIEVAEMREDIRQVFTARPGAILPVDAIEGYQSVDSACGRLRQLIQGYIDLGIWQLLWLPPALPYYQPGGPYDGFPDVTKRLIFSAWAVVPKAVASLVGYEVERRIFGAFEHEPENTTTARRARRPLLSFNISQGRLTGMPVLTLIYPSLSLASVGDPLMLRGDCLAKVADIMARVTDQIQNLLTQLQLSAAAESKLPDERWYWAAAVLLDLQLHPDQTTQWLDSNALLELGKDAQDTEEDGDETGRWSDHILELRRVVTGDLELGAHPNDLAEVLALTAVSSPAVCGLRALTRALAAPPTTAEQTAAARIGWAFRALFNRPEATALIRGLDRREPYWRRALEYSRAGNVQAVLDEYIHVLSTPPLQKLGRERRAETLSEKVAVAIRLRTVRLAADRVEPEEPELISEDALGFRGHIAQRFGRDRADDGAEAQRLERLRQAFNSPFWPFIVATTSIGQEGLDFHSYCHAVVHWNLPSNPVDLEQREGRVHRYKGHAVRKNLAATYEQHLPSLLHWEAPDPWEQMFELACADHYDTSGGILPYWVLNGQAKIERHVPMLPMSKEGKMLPLLRKSLTVYRLVFGQARQEDLIAFLTEQLSPEQIDTVRDHLVVNLAPPAKSDTAPSSAS